MARVRREIFAQPDEILAGEPPLLAAHVRERSDPSGRSPTGQRRRGHAEQRRCFAEGQPLRAPLHQILTLEEVGMRVIDPGTADGGEPTTPRPPLDDVRANAQQRRRPLARSAPVPLASGTP